MHKISLIGSCSFRTYFYLKALKNADIGLNEVIIYDYKDLDFKKFFNETIEYKGFKISIDEPLDELLSFYNAQIIDKKSINVMDNEITQSTCDFFIFSGRGGEIVKENILNLKKFLHVHPGKLPSYRGSTTLYYSLLNEGVCFATAFFLEKDIDTGKVVKELEFDIFDIDFDYLYDPFIRAYLLIDVLKNSTLSPFEQENLNTKEYYIIHPVLKKLALNKKCRISKNEKNL